LHAASNSLDDLPEWREWIGGHWVNGRSTHPPIGQATAQISAEHPVTAGLSDFTLFDEMYSHQYVAPESEVLVSHTYDDQTHPLVWATESDGRRALYDALGHDVRSFASAGRRELLRREVRWLLGGASGN
jgi:type 1 glutamine amidotransferase